MLSKLTQLSQKHWLKITLVFTFFFVFLFFSFPNLSFLQTRPDGVPANAVYNLTTRQWEETRTYDSSDPGSEEVIVTRTWDENGHLVGPPTTNIAIKKTASDAVGSITKWLANKALQNTVWFIVFLIGYIAGAIFYLGGLLITFALEINAQVVNMNVVHTGWVLTRDLANLGFVLGILVIAFATIIDYSSYNFKSLFRKFIITALLINFSLVIAGIILDFTGILTAHFATLGLAQGQGFNEFSSKLASVTQISALLNPDTGALANLGAQFSVQIFSLVFIVVFTVLAAIAFLGIAIMLITRFLYLAGLLIIAPLAWFTGIFPGIDYSRRWWSSFLQWSFFAPISMFFLYLSIAFLTDSNRNIQTVNTASQDIASNLAGVNAQLASSGALTQTLSQIGTMIVVIGFMYMSLVVGQKFGVYGAGMAISWADKARKWGMKHTVNAAASGAARAGRGIVRDTAGRFFTEERMEEWGEKGNFLKKLVAKPGMRLAQATAASKAAKQYEKFAKDLDDDKLAFEHQTAIDPAKKAAILQEAIKRGKLGDFKHLDLSDVNTLKTYFGEKAVKDLASKGGPTLSENYLKATDAQGRAKAITDFFDKAKPEDLSNLNIVKIATQIHDQHEGEEEELFKIIQNIPPSHFSHLTRNLSLADRREVANHTLLSSIEKDKASPLPDISWLVADTEIKNYLQSQSFQDNYKKDRQLAINNLSSWLETERNNKGLPIPEIDSKYAAGTPERTAAYRRWDKTQAEKIINTLPVENNLIIGLANRQGKSITSADDYVKSYKEGEDYKKKNEHLRWIDAIGYLSDEQKREIRKRNPELFDYIKNINAVGTSRKKSKKDKDEEEEETPPASSSVTPPPPVTP